MKNFIYVFCEQDRDELLRCGYTMLAYDEAQNIFVFVNREEHVFSQLTLPCLETDAFTL